MLEKFQKVAIRGLSWAFNNNGQQADPYRLRLIDGTPIHSTGLRRLFANTHFVGGVALTAAFAAAASANDTQLLLPYIIKSGTGALFGHGLAYTSHYLKIQNAGFNLNDHCFLTQPEMLRPQVSIAGISRAEEVKETCNKSIIIFAVPCFCFDLAIAASSLSQGNYDRFAAIPFSAVCLLTHILTRARFKKVIDGEWVIEDTPPPRKKSSLLTAAQEKLHALLPAPSPAPVSINS